MSYACVILGPSRCLVGAFGFQASTFDCVPCCVLYREFPIYAELRVQYVGLSQLQYFSRCVDFSSAQRLDFLTLTREDKYRR